ncbi:hypothetical protein PsorP6_011215 [Peronosclerospora sorghi]|uniref:Uncharacterized protein n=1 Tax=Peronosclerospora sorghi TaxID=230839 RepID=A0ACC0VVX9_9STRA|nr:hypothetical protein PsorP6_011215 [Peronosclerospora sorghi]
MIKLIIASRYVSKELSLLKYPKPSSPRNGNRESIVAYNIAVPKRRLFRDALHGLVVDPMQPKPLRVPLGPFVIVYERPGKVSPHICAF